MTGRSEKKNGAGVFSVRLKGRTRDNGHKLKNRKFHLNVRKNTFFTVRVSKHQNIARTSRTSGVAILQDTQNLPEQDPDNLLYLTVLWVVELDQMTFRSPFQHHLYSASMTFSLFPYPEIILVQFHYFASSFKPEDVLGSNHWSSSVSYTIKMVGILQLRKSYWKIEEK